MWGFSEFTIRRLIRDEPGVLRIEGLGSAVGKRSYTRRTIPESVTMRIYQRLTQPRQVVKLRQGPRRIVFLRDRKKG